MYTALAPAPPPPQCLRFGPWSAVFLGGHDQIRPLSAVGRLSTKKISMGLPRGPLSPLSLRPTETENRQPRECKQARSHRCVLRMKPRNKLCDASLNTLAYSLS